MTATPKTYVALLRGINVGGRAKVEMATLRSLFEALGCSDVSTYINSGNVLFRDRRSPAELVEAVETSLEETLGRNIHVIVRDLDSMRRLRDAIPAGWANDRSQKTDVLFLPDGLDPEALVSSPDFDPAREQVLALDGAVVWNASREHVPRGTAKLAGTELYARVTARNVNTVRKLCELMDVMG